MLRYIIESEWSYGKDIEGSAKVPIRRRHHHHPRVVQAVQ
jgi:hypothetical protein